jgi:hypothetical protein
VIDYAELVAASSIPNPSLHQKIEQGSTSVSLASLLPLTCPRTSRLPLVRFSLEFLFSFLNSWPLLPLLPLLPLVTLWLGALAYLDSFASPALQSTNP